MLLSQQSPISAKHDTLSTPGQLHAGVTKTGASTKAKLLLGTDRRTNELNKT